MEFYSSLISMQLQNIRHRMQQSYCLSSAVYCLLLGCLLSLPSCKKDSSIPEPDKKYGYFPVNVGHWIIYDVDSTVYDEFDNGKEYNYKFQIKEIIESEFTDNSGRPALRIERYRRMNDTLPWTIKNVWYANLTSSTAERVEENQRFVKLVFPPDRGETWNGNSYNTLGEQEYEYTAVDESILLNNMIFDSTLTVLQADDFNIIQKYYMEEKFAKNAGMIYKEYVSLKLNPAGTYPNNITGGIKYYMTIRSFGNS